MAWRAQGWYASALGSALYAREGAAGRGAPILLLHGLGETSRVFDPLAERLSQTRRLILPDLIGQGRSDYSIAPERVDIAALAASLERLIELEHLRRMILVGHDLGGVLALRLAQADPSRIAAIVLVEAGAPLNAAALRERAELLSRAAEMRSWPEAAKILQPDAPSEAVARKLLGAHAGRPAFDADMALVQHLAALLPAVSADPAAFAAVIAKPVIVVAPARTRIMDAEALGALAWKKPDLKRALIDAPGPDFLGQPKTLDAIEGFLKTCP